jgi:hypothetical protein
MPDDSKNSLSETAVSSIDPVSNVIKETGGFVKNIYIEQRLPALILTLTIVSLVTVIVSSPTEKTRLFLWFTTVPLLLVLTFFVLPRQGKETQKIKSKNKELKQENKGLRDSLDKGVRQVREQLSELTLNSINHLESVEIRLNDVKSQINEFLASQDAANSDEYLRELDSEISHLLEFVKLKRQEIDGLHARIPGAEQMLETSAEAAKFMAALQVELENGEIM